MADNELQIKIGANTDQFDKALEDVKKKSEQLESQLGNIAKISAVAFGALVAEIGVAVKAYAESEAASRKLTQALQNQGFEAKKTSEQYKKFAEEVQAKTGIDDDAIIASQALIQGFIGQQKVSKELTQSIADLSTQTGSLDAAAEILGRGIQGNVRGLKAYGITIDEGLTKQERMAQILEKVTQKFGGQAEAANQGLGSIKGLQTAFGNLQEEIGKRFAPAITAAIQGVTKFINYIQGNSALIDFASEFLKIGVVITGLILSFATAAIAIVKVANAVKIASAAMEILGISTRSLVGATGIGLILIIAAEIYANWSSIWPKMQAIFATFTTNIGSLGSGLASILTGVFTLDKGKIAAGLEQVKTAFSNAYKDVASAGEANAKERTETETSEDQKRIAKKKALADKAAAEELASERRKQNLLSAQREEIALEANNASAAAIDLKKQEIEILTKLDDDKYAAQRAALTTRFEEIQSLQEEQFAIDQEQKAAFAEQDLASNAEFQALSDEQRALFLAKNQNDLQSQILTESTARQQAAKQSLSEQIKNNNEYLLNQQKFGTAYAAINSIMNSAIYQGTKSAFGDLAQLQESSNSKLKAIGKAAAVANIIIRTAESAMNIYRGFSIIPFVGPALGVAGAAAAIAFGAEQIGKVTGAAQGGVITGGVAGLDSVPAMLTPGELVAPAKNFDEVIGSVRAQREAEKQGGVFGGGQSNGSVQVLLGFDGPEASQVLTARQNEDRALGISREAT